MENNEMKMSFSAISENESFARMVVAAFFSKLNPTLDALEDVKTAVSEAVTNAIVHGYQEKGGTVWMHCWYADRTFNVKIKDVGIGIENIENAMQPFFTTAPEKERSGMGFSFMEAFMDELSVDSAPGKGTVVTMSKSL